MAKGDRKTHIMSSKEYQGMVRQWEDNPIPCPTCGHNTVLDPVMGFMGARKCVNEACNGTSKKKK